MSKNHIHKYDYLNRKTDGLPTEKCRMEIIVTSPSTGDERFLCTWSPPRKIEAGRGYLGTASINGGKFKGIGFHAWEQNESEFIYYKIVE